METFRTIFLFFIGYLLMMSVQSFATLIDSFCTYLAGLMQTHLNSLQPEDEEKEETHTQAIGFQIPSTCDECEDEIEE